MATYTSLQGMPPASASIEHIIIVKRQFPAFTQRLLLGETRVIIPPLGKPLMLPVRFCRPHQNRNEVGDALELPLVLFDCVGNTLRVFGDILEYHNSSKEFSCPIIRDRFSNNLIDFALPRRWNNHSHTRSCDWHSCAADLYDRVFVNIKFSLEIFCECLELLQEFALVHWRVIAVVWQKPQQGLIRHAETLILPHCVSGHGNGVENGIFHL